MRKIRNILNTFLLLILVGSCYGQRFNFSVLAGLNAAQVNGDGLAGYDKMGVLAGARTNILINDRLDMVVEFLYSQQGSSDELTFSGRNALFNLDMDYLEIPVLIEIKDWSSEEKKDNQYFKVRFSAGLSYGRLFNIESSDNYGTNFKENDFKGIIALNYFLTRHIGFALRYSRSLIPLERIEENGREVGVIPHHISLYGIYSFL